MCSLSTIREIKKNLSWILKHRILKIFLLKFSPIKSIYTCAAWQQKNYVRAKDDVCKFKMHYCISKLISDHAKAQTFCRHWIGISFLYLNEEISCLLNMVSRSLEGGQRRMKMTFISYSIFPFVFALWTFFFFFFFGTVLQTGLVGKSLIKSLICC